VGYVPNKDLTGGKKRRKRNYCGGGWELPNEKKGELFSYYRYWGQRMKLRFGVTLEKKGKTTLRQRLNYQIKGRSRETFRKPPSEGRTESE